MIVYTIVNVFCFLLDESLEWPDINVFDCITDSEILEMAKELETGMEQSFNDEMNYDDATSHLREYMEAAISQNTKKKRLSRYQINFVSGSQTEA